MDEVISRLFDSCLTYLPKEGKKSHDEFSSIWSRDLCAGRKNEK